MGLFKRHWRAVLGVMANLPSLWHGMLWLFDWGARVDLVTAKLHEYGGMAAVIEFLSNPPPWFIFPAFVIGILLIWWDTDRRQKVLTGTVSPILRELVQVASNDESSPIPSETIASSNHHWQFDSQMACEIAARLRSRPEWQDKIIVDNVTPEYLWGLFHGRTSKDGDNLAKDFLNKWMVVCGPFGDVSSPLGKQMLVTFAFRNSMELVFMYFDEDWHDRLGIIIQNKKIAVIGRIYIVRSTMLQLEDCELVQ